MSPTPTPTPSPLPDDLRGADSANPEIAQRFSDALHDYAAQADGNLDALLANDTSPSPWFWLASATVAIAAALAVAAMVVFRPRIASSVPSVDGEFTFTPANPATDDLPAPPAPVNLDEENRP